jgi:predicted ATPase
MLFSSFLCQLVASFNVNKNELIKMQRSDYCQNGIHYFMTQKKMDDKNPLDVKELVSGVKENIILVISLEDGCHTSSH